MPIEMVRNDITKMKVDAIVNAANETLLGGGGVDGAIHRAAGPGLLAECRTLGGCRTGMAKITKGYDLPAKYVIHTVGPVWEGGKHGERELLAACYRHSLELAAEYDCETVAFPMISTGVYGYPADQAMTVALEEVSTFLYTHEMTVYLVVFGHPSYLVGKKLFQDVRAYVDDVYVDEHLGSESQRARMQRRMRERRNLPEEDILESPAQPVGGPAPLMRPMAAAASIEDTDWEEMLRQTDEGFSERLLRLIDEKGMTDAECYKRANVDRKLFSKIRSNPAYRPKKTTVLAFALALRLNLKETEDLLRRAGFAMTHTDKTDIIVEYFISRRRYNILEVNMVLFEHDLQLLGSAAT